MLLHICCGPCTIYPLKELRTKGFDVTGLYYNPNIHPYMEFYRRRQTLADYSEAAFLNMIWAPGYPMEEFLRNVAALEGDRCEYCLYNRMAYAAQTAQSHQYDAFTSTLLYSKYQKHDLIRQIGEDLSRKLAVDFYYEDFRAGWSEGVKISRELQMYRQPYCGCIYSEKERYYK